MLPAYLGWLNLDLMNANANQFQSHSRCRQPCSSETSETTLPGGNYVSNTCYANQRTFASTWHMLLHCMAALSFLNYAYHIYATNTLEKKPNVKIHSFDCKSFQLPSFIQLCPHIKWPLATTTLNQMLQIHLTCISHIHTYPHIRTCMW